MSVAVGMEAHGNSGIALAQQAVGLLPDPIARKAMEKVGVDPSDPLGTTDLVTHSVPLEAAPDMYKVFFKPALCR